MDEGLLDHGCGDGAMSNRLKLGMSDPSMSAILRSRLGGKCNPLHSQRLICPHIHLPHAQFKDAVVFHFNFTTPYRPSNEESLPGQPRPPVRTRKRSATNLAVVLARLGRNNRHLAPG